MAKKLNWINFQKTITDKQIPIFMPHHLRALFNVSKSSIQFFLHRNTKKGAIIKLRKNLYCLDSYRPSLDFIANKLYEPSYVSLESVLSRYSLIPETVYSITSVTTRASREFEAINMLFVYQKIKKQAFTGYVPAKNSEDRTILMAEPEKALIDYLYFVSLGKKSINDRFDLRQLNKKKLLQYAKLFNKPSLIELTKKVYYDYATNYNPVIY